MIEIVVVLVILSALVLIAGLVYGSWVSRRFSHLDKTSVVSLVSKLLVHGHNYETVNFEDRDGRNFAQFKKYILSEDDYGIDFVLPLTGRYENLDERLSDFSSTFDLKVERVKSGHGFDFAFFSVSTGENLIENAILFLLDLSEMDFQGNVHVTENSTFDWRRKDVVLGCQATSADQPHRYEMLSSQ